MDVVFVGLLVQEVKHVFDSQRQGASSMGSAEDGLKQVVHKFLERSLKESRRTSTGLAKMHKTREISLCVLIKDD